MVHKAKWSGMTGIAACGRGQKRDSPQAGWIMSKEEVLPSWRLTRTGLRHINSEVSK